MNRKAELEFRLRIERKNYKVAARKYRSFLRQTLPHSAGQYKRHMFETQGRIDAILEELEAKEN